MPIRRSRSFVDPVSDPEDILRAANRLRRSQQPLHTPSMASRFGGSIPEINVLEPDEAAQVGTPSYLQPPGGGFPGGPPSGPPGGGFPGGPPPGPPGGGYPGGPPRGPPHGFPGGFPGGPPGKTT